LQETPGDFVAFGVVLGILELLGKKEKKRKENTENQ
jgi:hypothetical protein